MLSLKLSAVDERDRSSAARCLSANACHEQFKMCTGFKVHRSALGLELRESMFIVRSRVYPTVSARCSCAVPWTVLE